MDDCASQSKPRPKASGKRPFPPDEEAYDLNWLKPLLFMIILDFVCDWLNL